MVFDIFAPCRDGLYAVTLYEFSFFYLQLQQFNACHHRSQRFMLSANGEHIALLYDVTSLGQCKL